MEEGTECPIPYMANSQNRAEQNYFTVEKKVLAIIFAVTEFH